MKEIKAIVQPFMLTKVVEALKQIDGLPGVTVDRDVRGFGRSGGDEGRHRIIDDLVEYVPKAKVEVVVEDHMVEQVIAVILKYAHTGNPGDGKVFVIPVEEVVRIRTGERGTAAV